MSKLSIIEEVGHISGVQCFKEVCNCGRKITKQIDKEIGICRVCNEFSPSNIQRVNSKKLNSESPYLRHLQSLTPNN